MPGSPTRWVVHKFGGTSVAGADRYRKVAAIIRDDLQRSPRQAVVVSAMAKVTDALFELVELARKRDSALDSKCLALRERHVETARELLAPETRAGFLHSLEEDFRAIREILRAVSLARDASERLTELVAGHGEVWSARLLSAYLAGSGTESSPAPATFPVTFPVTFMDAREVLVVDPGEKTVQIRWEESRALLEPRVPGPAGGILVITGYVARTPEGVATTLKRNGSDFSASIFGSLLDAESISIWTDVDGVLSADPRLVPEAKALAELSYQEATELAYFGAKVVHPSTMYPAFRKGIPIWIRNAFRPQQPGTQIHAGARPIPPVKGFSTIERMSLINVEGTGMLGVPGVASRLFAALQERGISVVLISQASSEHSICFAVPEEQAAAAREAVERTFTGEIARGEIQQVELLNGNSVLAAVGDGMVHHPGTAARFFGALGKAGINVRAIAQGSSERNISAVIESRDSSRALRAVHSAFTLSDLTLSVGLIGPGLIGGTLLRQLAATSENLRKQAGIDIRVRAIQSSRALWTEEPRIDLASWLQDRPHAVSPEPSRFLGSVGADHLPHWVLVDTTSDESISSQYADWLRKGFHVVAANKKANTRSQKFYREIREAARDSGRHFLYSTNVGAGLPIIGTIRDLVRTGDRLLALEGVLSGTLSFLFNSWDGTRPFSAILQEAMERGYTEPDPRDDLSGMDVARKLIILAREAGFAIELPEIAVESLVPEELRAVSREEFRSLLAKMDAPMEALRARAAGRKLRYVGRIEDIGSGKARAQVSLRDYDAEHAFSGARGTDNIVEIRTERYRTQPITIRGPGAGPEVTAGGVYADLLRLAAMLSSA